MKHEKWLSCLIGVLLSFGIAFSGICCMVTGFQLTTANMLTLVLICAAGAVLACVCFFFRHGDGILLASGALLLGFLIREGTLALQIEALLYKITRIYDGGYGWGYIAWSGESLTGVPVTGGLAIAAILVILVVSWTVIRKKSELFALLAGFLPLASCIVVTDTVPDEVPLFWLLFCLAFLLLTHPVRRKNPANAIRLTAILLIPVLLLCFLLFAAVPQATYSEQMNALQIQLIDWFNNLPFLSSFGVTADGPPVDRMDLAAIGPKLELHYAVMDVVAAETQSLYLRGQSFDTYDGMSWSASDISTGVDPYWPSMDLEKAGYIQVSTRAKHPQIYLPYYIAAYGWNYDFVNGKYENTTNDMQYSYYQKRIVPGVSQMTAGVDYSSGILKQCLELPEQTRLQAEKILKRAGITDRLSNAEKAKRIAQYVRNSAVYDLNTTAMPSDQTDFAIWFLQEGDTGYCVHFASAAAVLMRAAGVPARYVSGYTVSVQATVRKTVSSDRAHAWVEYLDPELGWQILEATPGEAFIEPETEPTETTTPTETEPPETEPSESTEPTDTTEPSQSDPMQTDPTQTKPSKPTEPTQNTLSSDSTDPQQGTSPGPGKQVWPPWLKQALQVAFWIVLACTLILAQYRIRIWFWQKRMHSGSPNRQALTRWRYLRRMKWAIGKKPPKKLEDLAEKAAFSQHTLTEDELQSFSTWLQSASQALQSKPWLWRTVRKLIFAVQ